MIVILDSANSAIEVFSAVVGDAVLVGGLMGLILTLFTGYKVESETNEITESVAKDIVEDVSTIAISIAQGVMEDAKEQESIIDQAYGEAISTISAANTELEKELSEMQKMREESEKTIDKKDSVYDASKKQYDDYMEYLRSQITKTDYLKQMVEHEKAQIAAEMESKGEWVKHKQADYIALKEEKAMLESVAEGFNLPGYNTAAVQDRLIQLEESEKDLNKVLGENNAWIDYIAKARGLIGPSQESKDLIKKIRVEREIFDKESAKENAETKFALKTEMDKNIAIYKEQLKKANRYDLATKAVAGIQWGSDTAIDELSYVTGLTGKQIKLAFTAGKTIATSVGEGMADRKNAYKHLAKGILNAGVEVLKDVFNDGKPWQATTIAILNKGLQSGLNASIRGENVGQALRKGLTKGVFDSGADKGLDAIKGALPIIEESSVDVDEFSFEQILNNNPLTKGLIKTTVKETTLT